MFSQLNWDDEMHDRSVINCNGNGREQATKQQLRSGHKSNDDSGFGVYVCVCVYACEWYSVLIFINHGQSFDNPSSSSSSVPDDSPDDRNGVDFN